MKNETNVLPSDFDGVFRFTNFTDSDFTAKWNNIEYTFPAQKMTPMVIPGMSPEEVQAIRKKFAKELAEQEFYKTPKFHRMNDIPVGHNPALYTESDLAPFISRCLEPLPIAYATTKVLPKDNTEKYSENTVVLDEKDLKSRKSLAKNDSGVLNL